MSPLGLSYGITLSLLRPDATNPCALCAATSRKYVNAKKNLNVVYKSGTTKTPFVDHVPNGKLCFFLHV
jgi:hypothetical protein